MHKKDELIIDLENDIAGKVLLSKFKDFCNCCYSLMEWCNLSLADIKFSIYIDICRGVINADKHVKITKGTDSYNSAYYRINVNGISPVIQSSTGGYVGNDSNPLYIDPGKNKLVVQTDKGTYDIISIVNGSINDWEGIIKSRGLI